jgi:hypothetical protein
MSISGDSIYEWDVDKIYDSKLPIFFPKNIKELKNCETAHLCRRGRATEPKNLVCINPFHIMFTTQEVNIDQNRCAYSNHRLCPHGNCMWTWPKTGRPKECLNVDTDIYDCICDPQCQHHSKRFKHHYHHK